MILRQYKPYLIVATLISALLISIVCAERWLVSSVAIKALLNHHIDQLTGSALTLEGDVHWSWLPGIGIVIKNAVITEKSSHPILVKADALQLTVKLMPLFSGRIEPDHLTITGLHLASSGADMTLNGKLYFNANTNQVICPDVTFTGHFKATQEGQTTFKGMGSLTYDLKHQRGSITQLKTTFNEDSLLQGDLSFQCQPWIVQGHLYSDAFKVGDLVMTQLKTEVHLNNSVIALNGLTARLYDGDYRGDIFIDTKPLHPRLTVNGQLTHANLNRWLADVLHKKNTPFTGTATISTMLSFHLGKAATLRETLQGHLAISVQNAVLHGIHIPTLLQSAKTDLNKIILLNTKEQQTELGALNATFQCTDGLLVNEDLRLNSPQLNAQGHGKIDLAKQQIDYYIDTRLKGHHTVIPIVVRGNLDNPTIAPDVDHIIIENLHVETNEVLALLTPHHITKKQAQEKLHHAIKQLNLDSLLH